jgi:hypothetical protein
LTGLRPLAPAEFAGDVEHWWQDNGDGTSTILSRQDVAPVLEANRQMARWNDGWSPSRELRRAAFIPNIIRDKWLNEEGWDAYRPDLYGEQLRRKLNDPDWRYLRTAEWRM